MDILPLYAGSSDDPLEITADERAEPAVTSELEASVEGGIVIDVFPDISATLESYAELGCVWIDRP